MNVHNANSANANQQLLRGGCVQCIAGIQNRYTLRIVEMPLRLHEDLLDLRGGMLRELHPRII